MYIYDRLALPIEKWKQEVKILENDLLRRVKKFFDFGRELY